MHEVVIKLDAVVHEDCLVGSATRKTKLMAPLPLNYPVTIASNKLCMLPVLRSLDCKVSTRALRAKWSQAGYGSARMYICMLLIAKG